MVWDSKISTGALLPRLQLHSASSLDRASGIAEAGRAILDTNERDINHLVCASVPPIVGTESDGLPCSG